MRQRRRQPARADRARRHDALAGKEYTAKLDGQSIAVTELGAGLRSYVVDGIELLDSYPADDYPTGSSYGQVLAPFPNRIDMGTYVYEGVEQQLR